MPLITIDEDNNVVCINSRVEGLKSIEIDESKIPNALYDNIGEYCFDEEEGKFKKSEAIKIFKRKKEAKALMDEMINADIVYKDVLFEGTVKEINEMSIRINRAELTGIGDEFKTKWRAKNQIIEVNLEDLRAIVKMHTLRELPLQEAYSTWLQGSKRSKFTIKK